MAPYATKTSQDETITLSTPDGAVTLYYPGATLPQSITSLVSSSSTSPTNPATQNKNNSSSSSGISRRLGLPVDDQYAMTTTIPASSNFAVAPHWHESYTEVFRVLSGYVLLRLGSKWHIIGPYSQYGQDAEIPPYTIHGFSRADVSTKECDAAWREFEKIHGVNGIRQGKWTGEETHLFEWTLPSDGSKEVFFRNTMSWARDNLAAVFASQGGKGSAGPGVLMIVWLLVTRLPRMLYMLAFMDTWMLLLDNNNFVARTSPGFDEAGRGGGGSKTKVGGYTGAGKEDRGPSTSSYYLTHGLVAVVKFIGGFLGWEVWRKEYTPEKMWAVADRMEKKGRN